MQVAPNQTLWGLGMSMELVGFLGKPLEALGLFGLKQVGPTPGLVCVRGCLGPWWDIAKSHLATSLALCMVWGVCGGYPSALGKGLVGFWLEIKKTPFLGHKGRGPKTLRA